MRQNHLIDRYLKTDIVMIMFLILTVIFSANCGENEKIEELNDKTVMLEKKNAILIKEIDELKTKNEELTYKLLMEVKARKAREAEAEKTARISDLSTLLDTQVEQASWADAETTFKALMNEDKEHPSIEKHRAAIAAGIKEMEEARKAEEIRLAEEARLKRIDDAIKYAKKVARNKDLCGTPLTIKESWEGLTKSGLKKGDKTWRSAVTAVRNLERCRRKILSGLDKGGLALMSTQRKIFAEQYELQMLDNGLDAKVRTSGAHSRYLSVTSVLMSRVTVHQALKDGELLNTFEDVGFKKVTFKNGYGFVQSFKLEPERENSIGQKALQGMGLGQPLKLEPTTSLTVGGEVKKAQTPGQKTTGVIWKDTRSGRTWQVSPTGKEMNWGKAKEHCKSLTLGGYHDWRLPTISELRSLIRGCRATQKHGSCKVTDSCLSYDRCLNDACSECLKKGGPSSGGMYWPSELSGDCCSYWSSSKVVADGKPSAWIIYFDDAGIYDGYHESDFFARCVR